eukprot:3219562-Pleurochrysis_carterae.AAC.3
MQSHLCEGPAEYVQPPRPHQDAEAENLQTLIDELISLEEESRPVQGHQQDGQQLGSDDQDINLNHANEDSDDGGHGDHGNHGDVRSASASGADAERRDDGDGRQCDSDSGPGLWNAKRVRYEDENGAPCKGAHALPE